MENVSKNIPNLEQNKVEKYNPNSIGELLSIGRDLETQPDKVYRSVRDKEAIDDIEKSGVVRNRQSAGLVEKSRWGDRVFWSRGAEGKYHNVQVNGYVIEAPLSVAQDRVVAKEDITAIYTKNESGEVVDLLQQKNQAEEENRQSLIAEINTNDKEALIKLRKELGINE